MKCPFCRQDNDKVVDSRSQASGIAIRRRRECLACLKRYTTYEKIEDIPLKVIKKNGERVDFSREKILVGLRKACEKRGVDEQKLIDISRQIELKAEEQLNREVTTRFVGELIMDALKKLDGVAYVRYASVYREFRDLNDFVKELQPMLGKD